MAILKWLLIVAVVAVAAALLAGRLGWLEGQMPDDLGVHDGRLKPPSNRPNSVSSQAGLYPEHPMREQATIAPLPVVQDGAATLARIRAIVEATPGAQVVRTENDYLYAQYRSRLMGYVDDVEFWFDPVARVIQVRSASRLGHGDLGANRARVEALRARLAGG